jgi:deoxyribose-phosphate aldolase
MASSRPKTLTVSLPELAKMIDHSLLHPTMTDDDVSAGLQISRKYSVATACVKPYQYVWKKNHPFPTSDHFENNLKWAIANIHLPSILFAKKILEGSSVLVCPVIGFPHGNSTTQIKVYEAIRAVEEGGKEIDMVVNIGRVLSGKWEFVKGEIEKVNRAVVERGAILKVIFENDCEFWISK